jgi:flavin-dependent dehydrogenase
VFDLAVIGAGPAGATLAASLRRKNRSVVLIERDRFPRRTASIAWLNARAVPWLRELEVPDDSLSRHALRDVLFVNADFSRTAKPRFAEPPGCLIQRAELENGLVKAAAAAGVECMEGIAASRIRPRESSVDVELSDGRLVSSRLLAIACGAGSRLPESVGVPPPATTHAGWLGQVDGESPDDGTDSRLTLILGGHPRGGFGWCAQVGRRAAVALSWCGDRRDANRALVGLCEAVYQRNFVSVDLSAAARDATFTSASPAAALDMDTHVAKHTLVIGEAGGFAAAISHEGLYPAMWSARIAAHVMEAALDAARSQDELMTFNSAWRMQMADYLRSPSTEIQLLLPMIFTNQPMTDRMGTAFFLGAYI